MNQATHPIEREEVMAYLDGELDAARAAAVGAHIEQCAECQTLAADFRGVSARLAAWQVEPAPARVEQKISAALPREAKPARRWLGMRPWVWQLASGFAVLLVIAAISIPSLHRSREAANWAGFESQRRAGEAGPGASSKDAVQEFAVKPGVARAGKGAANAPTAKPMIIRTAALTIITKEFDNTRAAMEQAVRAHGGWIAQLSATGQAGGARSLTVTLRIPADKLDAALAELKKLGRVQEESIGGEEVTQQYVDLVARLDNARHTEQRLVEVLRTRTGKVSEVLEVEQEIARVREEIEQMDAQRKNMEKQVAFSTVTLRISEEYKAELSTPQPSVLTQLWNAAVEGYHSLTETVLGLALFLLSYGPPALFWLALLFWPARYAWRRIRASAA